jgi:hypothetical protein
MRSNALAHPEDYAVGTPWFDYAFRAFNPERRLEDLIEWQWERFATPYANATARTHIVAYSFEFGMEGMR